MRVAVAALTSSLALVLGGCGGATESEPGGSGAATVEDAYSVEFISSGSGDKVELRLPTEVGLEQTLRTTVSQQLTVQIGDMSQSGESTTSQTMTVRITAVEGDEIVTESRVDDAQIDMGADTHLAAAGDAIADAFIGKVITQRWTDRGAILSVEAPELTIDVPAGLGIPSQQFNDMMNQLWSSMEDSAKSMSVPTPDEPVGVGASWVVNASMTMLGIPVELSTAVNVTEITDESVIGDVDQAFTLIPGEVMVQGQSVTLKEGNIACDGTITYLRKNGIGPHLNLDCDSSTTMIVSGNTIKQDIRMTQRTDDPNEVS